jgi:class 3 adenylate cyclase
MARALIEAAKQANVSEVLPTIRVPTLVLHRTGDIFPIAGGRYFAKRVSGARFVELPGDDHAFWAGDYDAVVDEIQKFLTGAPASTEPDRVLATLLFTDIVGSTRRVSEVGDQRWHQLLELHNSQVRALLDRFGGRELNTMGDGFFASFDGPGRAVECAGAIVSSLNSLGVTVRAGVHTGECERIGEKLGGLAVHVAARIAAVAEANEVLVSSTVRDLVVGSRLRFKDRGSHELRGVQGSWHLFAVARDGSDSVKGAPRLAGPREGMSRMDQGVVAVAKHMPWLLRLLARFAGTTS